MQGKRKSDRGLIGSQKSATIVTFVDGSQARLWGFAHGRQVSNLQHQRRLNVATVLYAVVQEGGRGDIVQVAGTFVLNGLELVAA